MSSPGQSSEKARKCVYVLSDIDGYKYKLVLQGELRLLGTRKIKRYLERAAHIAVAEQQLSINGRLLEDCMNGDDIGLFDGAILRLHRQHPYHYPQQRQESAGGAPPLLRASGGAREDVAPAQRPSNGSSGAGWHADGPRTSRGPGGVRQSTATDSPRRDGLDGGDYIPPTRVARQSFTTSMYSSTTSPRDGVWDCEPCKASPPRYRSEQRPSQSRSDGLPPGRDVATSGVTTAAPGRGRSASPQQQRQWASSMGPNPSSSPSGTGGSILARLEDENQSLRSQLHDAQRRATASDASDRQLLDEVAQLRRELAVTKGEAEAAAAEAEEVWRVKEYELVQELDALREERRRLKKEREHFLAEQEVLMRDLTTELRVCKEQARAQEELVQQLRYNLAETQSRQNPVEDSQPRVSNEVRSVQALARDCLAQLSTVLDVPMMELDASNTCVVQVSDHLSVLVTLDGSTERLYLYSTLLNHLPHSAQDRLAVYEMVLEGSLLGKDMAGGGVGICRENNLMLMSISVDVRHCDAAALSVAARPFVEAVDAWSKAVAQLLEDR